MVSDLVGAVSFICALRSFLSKLLGISNGFKLYVQATGFLFSVVLVSLPSEGVTAFGCMSAHFLVNKKFPLFFSFCLPRARRHWTRGMHVAF